MGLPLCTSLLAARPSSSCTELKPRLLTTRTDHFRTCGGRVVSSRGVSLFPVKTANGRPKVNSKPQPWPTDFGVDLAVDLGIDFDQHGHRAANRCDRLCFIGAFG